MRADPHPAMSCAVQSPSRKQLSHALMHGQPCISAWLLCCVTWPCLLACVSAHGQFGPVRRKCLAFNIWLAGAWQSQLITCQVMVPAARASRTARRQPEIPTLRSAGARAGPGLQCDRTHVTRPARSRELAPRRVEVVICLPMHDGNSASSMLGAVQRTSSDAWPRVSTATSSGLGPQPTAAHS